MHYLHLRVLLSAVALFSLSHCNLLAIREDDLLSTHAEVVHTRRSARQLRAAQVESRIGKRSVEQALQCDHELHYVDGKCCYGEQRHRGG